MANKDITVTEFLNEVINNKIRILEVKKTYKNNNLKTVEYFNDAGELHRINGPAVTHFHDNGTIHETEWYLNGRYHREGDLPARELFDRDGFRQAQRWYKNGEYHREGDLPADIITNKHSKEESWYINGDTYRGLENKPDFVSSSDDGKSYLMYFTNNGTYLEWRKDGKLHREGDLPAYIEHNKEKELVCQKWYNDGKLHRPIENGPSVIKINKNYTRSHEYYLDDQLQDILDIENLITDIKKFSKEDIEKCLEILEIMKK